MNLLELLWSWFICHWAYALDMLVYLIQLRIETYPHSQCFGGRYPTKKITLNWGSSIKCCLGNIWWGNGVERGRAVHRCNENNLKVNNFYYIFLTGIPATHHLSGFPDSLAILSLSLYTSILSAKQILIFVVLQKSLVTIYCILVFPDTNVHRIQIF